MRPMLPLIVAVLAGCQRAALSPAGVADPLAREVAGRAAGSPQACISALPNQNLRVIDAATVAYDLGGTIWINRLRQACPALDQLNTVIVERTGPHICRGDRVRGLEPGAVIAGPPCNLQSWVPYRLR